MKICKLCGEDCSQRPRVKDAEGAYYCKTCHAAAAERKQELQAQAHAVAPPAGLDHAAGD